MVPDAGYNLPASERETAAAAEEARYGLAVVLRSTDLVMLAAASHGNTSPIFFSNTKYTIP